MSKKNGFTLIEVLVTIGLVVMIFSIAGSSLFFIIRATTDIRGVLYQDREVMKAYAQMRQQLLSFYLSPTKEYSLKGTPGKNEGEDEILFLSAAPIYSSCVAQVGYSIQKDDQGKTYLAYSEFPYPYKEDFAECQWKPLTKKITGLKIRYFEMTAPVDNWEKGNFPDRIEITFLRGSGEESDKMTFTVTPAITAKFW